MLVALNRMSRVGQSRPRRRPLPVYPCRQTISELVWLRICARKSGTIAQRIRSAYYVCAGRSPYASQHRGPSWTSPVERNVLARVRCPLEVVAERIHGADGRFTPGHELRAGSSLRPGRVHELRIFTRRARWPGQRLRPGFHLSGNLCSPVTQVGRDLERDACPLHAKQLSALGKKRSPLSGKASDLAADNARKHLGLALICAVVDEETGRPLGLTGPKVAFPASDPKEAEIVEVNVPVVATPDVPEENRLAKAVVRGLGKGAGARDGAAAIVEPIPRNVPAGNLGHDDLHSFAERR